MESGEGQGMEMRRVVEAKMRSLAYIGMHKVSFHSVSGVITEAETPFGNFYVLSLQNDDDDGETSVE